jgi:hypothetical protein
MACERFVESSQRTSFFVPTTCCSRVILLMRDTRSPRQLNELVRVAATLEELARVLATARLPMSNLSRLWPQFPTARPET